MKRHDGMRIEGQVSAGFDAVRDAFAENFSRRHELGGACCVYHRGEKVVDLWGGVRNKSTREPWQEDTMVLVYSTTKGLAAMTLAVAHAYSVFATGGRELHLRPETLQALSAPAIPATHGFYDECMMADGVQFSLGFMKHGPVWSFRNEASFGFPGSGGSLGFADPKAGIGYAYVTNQMGTALTGDPRDLALRNAVYSIIEARP